MHKTTKDTYSPHISFTHFTGHNSPLYLDILKQNKTRDEMVIARTNDNEGICHCVKIVCIGESP